VRSLPSMTAAVLLSAMATFADGPRPGPTASPELVAEVKAQDRALFAALFDRCDVPALQAIVADDLEFFHDKSGLQSRSGAQWIEGVRGMCERQKAGTDYRARREVDEPSQVFALKDYGAIHIGTHRFYGVDGERKGKLLEVAQFFNVWRKDATGWRLARVFSYDHRVD
jgi:ketosteroid isomerase-like protein